MRLTPGGQPKGKSGGAGCENQGKSRRKGGGGETKLPVLGKRRWGDDVEMRVSVESNSAEVDMGLGTVYVSMGTPKNASPDVTPELKGASMMAQCGSTATGGDAGAEEKLPIPDGVGR
ncbi:hypothetical protein PF010_g19356 [Phytophthora fragariae]|uniref:Uncharacterized protein n=1 Tax=Phytophthora fragariae TaxID=53985 RepID=A0A6A3R315_9STRA|nr:hypothetical protein PF003_g23666 [Phytophthora fragariae]KAE8929242.1 hypothetical protein PF009_g20645 [Phytophthora fragariae]KAE9009273.1 hypothetical protein PF011_g10347 [Phytophthora fragariae]KAE9088406.1 hypothetical protein PF007_g19982 [Phytophthora fragariae]KAE9088511.1 hypothetical protein PF010_g19356 [Phytophthora fragariae]